MDFLKTGQRLECRLPGEDAKHKQSEGASIKGL